MRRRSSSANGAVRDILVAYWTRDVESNCRLWFRSLLRHRTIGAGGGRPVVDHGVAQPAFLGAELTRVLGGVLIIAGVPGLVDSFARFALEGLGTPAPVAPTQKLIVTGLYRYVRNPMYIAVVTVILGQALLFGDERLLSYGALFWLACHVFVVTYEEPTLRRTFGLEYEAFRADVPRWIPRLTPWRAV